MYVMFNSQHSRLIETSLKVEKIIGNCYFIIIIITTTITVTFTLLLLQYHYCFYHYSSYYTCICYCLSPRSSVTGETSISMEVPDTVTEWIGSGFCTSVEYGVGVSPPTKLRAFQPFFLSYTLPYSVVRGEVVPITVTVFNYLTESLVVGFDSIQFEVCYS